jgi:hypothetical protein
MLDSGFDPEDVPVDYQYSSAEYGDAKTPCRRSRHSPCKGGKETMGGIVGIIIVVIVCIIWASWYLS